MQADRSSKTSKEGSLHENEYNTCWSISIFIANRQVNTSWSWLPVRSKHPLLPHQYVINAPVIISAGDIKRIAEVVKRPFKTPSMMKFPTRLMKKFTITKPPQQLQVEKTNHRHRWDLDELVQYGWHSLTRLSGIAETFSEDTEAKILEARAGI